MEEPLCESIASFMKDSYPYARERRKCHICRVHRLRNSTILEFTLKVIKHNEGFICNCVLQSYCKECFEIWLTFFRGACPLCLRYKELPPTQSKINTNAEKKDLKCYICEERKNITSGGIEIIDTREEDAPKCTCNPIPLHQKCAKKWIKNCAGTCPKCFLQC